jgi:DNA-binding protein HU-beta
MPLTEGEEELPMLTKAQTITKLSEKMALPKKQVAMLLEELSALAIKETKSGGQFVVPGFGKLVKASRKARMGRNPQTGEAIKIPARTVVRFRIAKAMKDAVVPPKAKK